MYTLEESEVIFKILAMLIEFQCPESAKYFSTQRPQNNLFRVFGN
jgi:hypothetical protein